MKKNRSNKISINSSNLELNNFDRNKFKINLNRIAFVFILIVTIIVLYSTRIIYLSSKTLEKKKYFSNQISRADIIDRNGNYVSKSVLTTNIGIDPKLVKDKKKLLIKLQYTFPEKDISEIKKSLTKKNFFYIEKNVTPDRFKKIKLLGEKSIRLEPKITRIYPDKNLFSHILGQIDDDNNGISGIEKSFDNKLKNSRKQLVLTLDKKLQFIIRKELLNARKDF
jgi:Cell division protein FtsI/penicillin-binding protein 2